VTFLAIKYSDQGRSIVELLKFKIFSLVLRYIDFMLRVPLFGWKAINFLDNLIFSTYISFSPQKQNK
jgi:hypothetical protein